MVIIKKCPKTSNGYGSIFRFWSRDKVNKMAAAKTLKYIRMAISTKPIQRFSYFFLQNVSLFNPFLLK